MEVLIAITLGALVLTGLYSAVDISLNTEQRINRTILGINEYTQLTRLFQRDMRTMIDSPGMHKTPNGTELTFNTTHSFLYNSSRPVKVSYYCRKIEGKEYLFREESEDKNRLILRLLGGIDNLSFSSKYNEKWIEKIVPGKPIKMSYKFKKKNWEIIAGKIL